jgi:hypothetical protein
MAFPQGSHARATIRPSILMLGLRLARLLPGEVKARMSDEWPRRISMKPCRVGAAEAALCGRVLEAIRSQALPQA